MGALDWLSINPNDEDAKASVEDAKAFIRKHPDALMGIYDDFYEDNVVPLHYAIDCLASDEVILLLLEACPQAAAAEIEVGLLPLHLALNEDTMCSEEVIKALLNVHPGAASARNSYTGNLPLHDAVKNMNASEGILLLLLNAYPQAAAAKMTDGRFLFEIYLERKASDDLMREICKVRVDDGLLPLGFVLTKRSSDDIVLAVLKAYPEAAGRRFSTNCDECILPLHIAYEDEHSEPVKDALRHAYPDAEKENPFGTTHLLHKLLENAPLDQGVNDVRNLINMYPEAVGKRGRDGRLPLHIAIDRIAPGYVTIALFEAYPQAGKEKMKDGRLPIEVFVEQKVTEDWTQSDLIQMVTELLKYDMPVSIEDGTPVEHSDGWFACISYNTETATCAVREVLSEFGFGKHIHALAEVRDAKGRPALGLAAEGPREVIYEYLLFCGRYKLQSGPPEHRTATSVVLRAEDLAEQVDEQPDFGVIFDKADIDRKGKLERKELKAITVKIGLDPDLFLIGLEESDESISKGEFVSICKRHLGGGRREVVIKLMQEKVQWERECNARKKFDLNPKYVVSALSNAPPDTEIAKAVREGDGGLDAIKVKFLKNIVLGKYVIVMDAADRNLHQIFFQEQPKIDAVRVMLRQVFEAVKHLHEEKLMHGDIKMGNIVRFLIDNKLRLIDLDASARIDLADEQSFAGVKFSSAILPPEMIERIEKDQVQGFLKYWKVQNDKDLDKKVAPKIYLEQGIVKAHYVVKSFRTEEGKPVEEGLPYKLVHASESIDLWSLGVLAFTLLTGEPLIPSTRDDDCASGAAMHILHSWGTQPEVLIELFNKITDDAAFDLVWKLLQKEPGKRKKVADLLKSHPFFHPENVANTQPRSAIFGNLLFYGRYKLFDGPPEHRSQTSVVFRAQDLDKQADYSAIFDKADTDKNGNLDRQELEKIASSIGLNPELFLKGSDAISKENFIDVCKRQLSDGPREKVIKLMKNKDQWERECNARAKYNLDPKYVVTAQPVIPPEDDIANANERGDGGLNAIVKKFLKDIKLGKYVIVMDAADRNLHQIFFQEQPKLNTMRDMLRELFEAVKHMHGQKLMHGDIKMLNIVRFRIDNKLRLIDLDASARIVPPGGEEEKKRFAGVKFSSAILPPEMIERIVTEEQLEKFNAYWERENDKDLKEKVAPKLYQEPGKLKAHYVVKSFRTDEEGKPVEEGLPYELKRASENIDLWSLGVLAFTLLTGEPLIPSTRDDDCASGAAMHILHSWGTQPEVLSDLFKKITDDAARDLVMQLLKSKPEERPTVASLLATHPFFNQKNLAIISQFKERLEDFGESLKSQAKQLEIMNANILVIKKLSYESQSELLRTRHVLLKGIFEATEVRTPTAFIVLNNKLPPEPSNGDKEKMLDFVTNEDGSGVSVQTKYASVTFSAEGADLKLKGDLKEHYERAQDGIEWVKRIKRIGSKVAAGEIGTAFEIIKEEIIKEKLVGNEMYLYLIDELTGEPVRAEGWPIKITEPSELVHKLLPLMLVGMRAMSIYNGTAGMARLFGYPLPKVPKAWSKGAQESVELLKQDSSVEEFSVVHEEVKGGSEEKKSVRGASLREFMDFLEKEDPGRKDGKTGHFAGLQRIGDPDQGTALWTMLTDQAAIERALNERASQRKEEERTQNEHNQHGKTAKVKVVTQEETNEETSGTEEVHEFAELNDTRNAVAASKEIDELIRAAKEATASAKEATAAANAAASASAPSAAQDAEEVAKLIKQAATAAAKEAASAPAAANVCCTIM